MAVKAQGRRRTLRAGASRERRRAVCLPPLLPLLALLLEAALALLPLAAILKRVAKRLKPKTLRKVLSLHGDGVLRAE